MVGTLKALPADLIAAAASLEAVCAAEPWFASVDPAVLDGVPVLFLVTTDYQATVREFEHTYRWQGYPLLLRRSNTLRAVVAAGEKARKR